MQVIDRFVIALALPAGFFLGVGAYGFAQLLSLPGGILIGGLLLLGCVALFFTERILEIVFDSVFTSGVVDAIDPAAKRRNNKKERRVRHKSWRMGALGGAAGVLASMVFSPVAVMEFLSPVIGFLA